ncbi:MAG: type II toxin-antitoxin system VapC family toxin [Caulobacteraceae bacterium]|nr:type II toxin-antitoxin system VapC family toxin [Caulobacteraceae bacterium]
MLDTNAVSYLVRAPRAATRAKLSGYSDSDLCISAITEGELRFGLAKRPGAPAIARLVESFLARVEVLPFGSAAASRYGVLRAALVAAGTPIGDLDTLIAAHALSEDAVLVTSDRALKRVVGLRVEDWTAE